LFNLIAKEDSNASIELAKDSRTIVLATKHDSSSMKTVAFLTMLFLPATFFAAFFAMPVFDWEGPHFTTQHFWIYSATTLPVTLLVFVVWFVVTRRKEIRDGIEDQRQRINVLKRIKSYPMDVTTSEECSKCVESAVLRGQKGYSVRTMLRHRKRGKWEGVEAGVHGAE
jgi:hypothetical protein